VKKYIVFALLLLFIISIASIVLFITRNGNEQDFGNDYANANIYMYNQINGEARENVGDEYVWIVQNGFMQLDVGNTENICGIAVYGELIYYIYIEFIENIETVNQTEPIEFHEAFSAVIQIKAVNHYGSIMDRISIPTLQNDTRIKGFDITNNGEFIIVTQELDWENSVGVLYYTKYDSDGNVLLRTELLQTGITWFAHEVHFEKNGALAIIGVDSYFNEVTYFWDETLHLVREEPTSLNFSAFTRDGTFLSLSIPEVAIADDALLTLYEIEVATKEIINEYSISNYSAGRMFIAEEDSTFDFYVIAGRYLYGYVKETGEVETIIDFSESQINISNQRNIALFADGGVAIIKQHENMGFDTHAFIAELAILRPIHRYYLADVEQVILVGFALRPIFIDQVMDFNRRNPEIQIIVYDYWSPDDNFGFGQAIERFHLDMIAGNIPDMILFEDPTQTDLMRVREALVRQGVLLDLYYLIDADSELSRDDFFRNVMHGFENADGELPVIGNWLTISTMISTNPSLRINSWDIDDFLTIMEQEIAKGNLEPLGGTLTGISFLTTMLEHIGDYFVDKETGTSYFESENFVRFLELTAAIPENPIYSDWPTDYFPDFNALLRGVQAVDLVGFGNFAGLSDVFDTEPPPSFTYIGLPGTAGGQHNIRIWGTFSIFSNSQNVDAAWRFVRETLLPNATDSIALTLRTDDFEDRLSTSTMTINEQETMREIMNNAIVQRPLSETIIMIIKEDFLAFYNGNRTAEESARIIQNRVQRYIDEHG